MNKVSIILSSALLMAGMSSAAAVTSISLTNNSDVDVKFTGQLLSEIFGGGPHTYDSQPYHSNGDDHWVLEAGSVHSLSSESSIGGVNLQYQFELNGECVSINIKDDNFPVPTPVYSVETNKNNEILIQRSNTGWVDFTINGSRESGLVRRVSGSCSN